MFKSKSDVKVGSESGLPLPLIKKMVKEAIHRVVEQHLAKLVVAPNLFTIELEAMRRKKTITEDDLSAAYEAAMEAAGRI